MGVSAAELTGVCSVGLGVVISLVTKTQSFPEITNPFQYQYVFNGGSDGRACPLNGIGLPMSKTPRPVAVVGGDGVDAVLLADVVRLLNEGCPRGMLAFSQLVAGSDIGQYMQQDQDSFVGGIRFSALSESVVNFTIQLPFGNPKNSYNEVPTTFELKNDGSSNFFVQDKQYTQFGSFSPCKQNPQCSGTSSKAPFPYLSSGFVAIESAVISASTVAIRNKFHRRPDAKDTTHRPTATFGVTVPSLSALSAFPQPSIDQTVNSESFWRGRFIDACSFDHLVLCVRRRREL